MHRDRLQSFKALGLPSLKPLARRARMPRVMPPLLHPLFLHAPFLHALFLLAPLLLTLTLAAPATTAHAAQTLDVRDGDTALARISLRDQTRIKVEAGRILEVLGDLYDARLNPQGRLTVVRDEADGEVYVKPVTTADAGSANATAQAVKLDLKTDRGTFAVLLQPADVVGDTLVLRPAGLGVGSVRPAVAAEAPAARTGSQLRAIKALTLAMANPTLAQEVPSRMLPGAGHEVALWREARFVLRSVHALRGLVGESYELTNVSAQRMVIDERELYASGIVSVAVRRLVLQPGETTPVWIVRAEARPGAAAVQGAFERTAR